MIVQMEIGVDAENPHTQRVVQLADSCGLRTEVKTTKGTGAAVTEVYLLDDRVRACTVPEHVFRPLAGVSYVRRVTPSAVSLTANGSGTHHVRLGPVAVGNDLPCQLIVGPCTVDRHIGVLVAALKEQGFDLIRGGCWKPRSNPHSFPGFGKKAVRWLLEAAQIHDVSAVFTEVIDETHLDDIRRIRDELGFEGTIVLWVGARTENQILLRKLGRQREFPVMLKNPIGAHSVADWAERAAFVLAGETHFDDNGALIADQSLSQGNDQILLCARGVKEDDAESRYRFDPRHHWISTAREKYWPPVGVDPSHSAGTMVDDLVLKNLEAALVHKPAFVMVETYFDANNPLVAQPLCDGQQAIPLSRLGEVQALIAAHNERYFSVAAQP